MKTKIFIALCFALTLCVQVYADAEEEIRRGVYPYMAFLYYPDESVVDATGSRFLRGAVLIRSDWLVTSAVGPKAVPGAANGFPKKTLLARLGAITIDTNFTLNEDEDEQEREVIRIIRPYNNSATQWWLTDISLMKVLLPFNITSAVSFTKLNPIKHDIADKTCIILVFAKRSDNDTEDRSLRQIYVEMQPPSIENCGSHFIDNTMTCADDSDDSKNAAYDTNFCQGNSGGPLICENEVVGIQTYIDNNCKQPHLYQLLSGWNQYISCGTDDKCQEKECTQVCDAADKDATVTSTTETSDTTKAMLTLAESTPMLPVTSAIPDTTTDDSETVTTTQEPNLASEEVTTTDILPSVPVPTPTHLLSEGETGESKSWPNEKYTNERKSLGEGDTEITDRKPKVEAQHHINKPLKKSRSAGRSNTSDTLSLFFGFIILACLT